jgi:hypothetical protein
MGAVGDDLNDRAFLGPGEMVHLRRCVGEAAGRERGALGLIELVSHAQRQFARDDGDIFIRGMAVRGDLVASRHAQADGEKAGLGRITGQDRHFRAFRESCGRRAPFQVGSIHLGLGGRRERQEQSDSQQCHFHLQVLRVDRVRCY